MFSGLSTEEDAVRSEVRLKKLRKGVAELVALAAKDSGMPPATRAELAKVHGHLQRAGGAVQRARTALLVAESQGGATENAGG